MPDSESERPSTFLISFTLLGSYCLGTNLAIALHEFGHLAGCWIGGGKPVGLVLGPQGVSGSYAARDLAFEFTSEYGYLVQTWGGVAFGTLFGVVLLVAARCFNRGSIGWIVGYMTGTMCVANNGGYLFFGGLSPFDDAAVLVDLGVPRWLLIVAGLLLLTAFVGLFTTFLRRIGLRIDDPFWKWLATIELGILLYLGFAVALRILWHPPLPVKVGPIAAATPPALLILAAAAFLARRMTHEVPTAEPRWWKAGVVLALGVLFVAAEMLFFSFDFDAIGAQRALEVPLSGLANVTTD